MPDLLIVMRILLKKWNGGTIKGEMCRITCLVHCILHENLYRCCCCCVAMIMMRLNRGNFGDSSLNKTILYYFVCFFREKHANFYVVCASRGNDIG